MILTPIDYLNWVVQVICADSCRGPPVPHLECYVGQKPRIRKCACKGQAQREKADVRGFYSHKVRRGITKSPSTLTEELSGQTILKIKELLVFHLQYGLP